MISGIDVSHWQGQIDWQAVAKSGAKFMFCKATEGIFYNDRSFANNVKNAKAVGLRVGAYHFYEPSAPGDQQAKVFLDAVRGIELDMPPVVDVEKWDAKFLIPGGRQKYVASILGWLVSVQSALKVVPMVYTRASYWDNAIGVAGWEKRYPLWVAHYKNIQGIATKPTLPKAWDNWLVWQHSEKGSIPGIAGQVDLDLYNGSLLPGEVPTPTHWWKDWQFSRLPDKTVVIAKGDMIVGMFPSEVWSEAVVAMSRE